MSNRPDQFFSFKKFLLLDVFFRYFTTHDRLLVVMPLTGCELKYPKLSKEIRLWLDAGFQGAAKLYDTRSTCEWKVGQ
ncbi:hypothetical protein D3C77_20780 [compost metagenome]|jgi:hypothetical protein